MMNSDTVNFGKTRFQNPVRHKFGAYNARPFLNGKESLKIS